MLTGVTHNSSVYLYREGQEASPALKLFAELGDASGLESTAQGEQGVLDQFTAPKVPGEGSTHTQVYVDGAHSKVSRGRDRGVMTGRGSGRNRDEGGRSAREEKGGRVSWASL